MGIDDELQKHDALLLGIGSPWEVKTVELKLAEKKVEIELGWQWGAAARCPECGRECSIHDSAPERTWRHLDTMQFTTLIRARTPRSNCPEHGVKTMTRSRICAEVSLLRSPDISRNFTGGTSMWRSIRSSKGPKSFSQRALKPESQS